MMGVFVSSYISISFQFVLSPQNPLLLFNISMLLLPFLLLGFLS